jgi:hypothetical protein
VTARRSGAIPQWGSSGRVVGQHESAPTGAGRGRSRSCAGTKRQAGDRDRGPRVDRGGPGRGQAGGPGMRRDAAAGGTGGPSGSRPRVGDAGPRRHPVNHGATVKTNTIRDARPLSAPSTTPTLAFSAAVNTRAPPHAAPRVAHDRSRLPCTRSLISGPYKKTHACVCFSTLRDVHNAVASAPDRVR